MTGSCLRDARMKMHSEGPAKHSPGGRRSKRSPENAPSNDVENDRIRKKEIIPRVSHRTGKKLKDAELCNEITDLK